MDKLERLDTNYDAIRYEYEIDLVEHGYATRVAKETNDGRDEFVDKEYNIYLENIKGL